MSTERTYVFGGDGGNGGSKLDITALLPGMLGGRSVDPNLLALMGNRNGFGGQDGWWSIIWLVVIASIFGWNGNSGFFGGGRGVADGSVQRAEHDYAGGQPGWTNRYAGNQCLASRR